MEKMQIYEAVRKVPDTAKREIAAGRLKGKTDINPMWRIKTLTELCGAAGIGWRTEIVERWTDANPVTGEVIANIRILLHVNLDGAERAIEGIGGSMLIANESKGIFTDDEAWKKAYTDAISVACKALGIGADVYWDKDSTKYTAKNPENAPRTNGNDKVGKNTTDTTKTQQSEKLVANEPKQDRAKMLIGLMTDAGIPNSVVIEYMKAHHDGKKVAELNDEDFGKLMNHVGDVAKRWEQQRAERLGEEHGYEE